MKFELEEVVEALSKSVEVRREEVAKADDPEERGRAAERLEQDATALGRWLQVMSRDRLMEKDLSRQDRLEMETYVNNVGKVAMERGLSINEGVALLDMVRSRLTFHLVVGGSGPSPAERLPGGPSVEGVVDDWIRRWDPRVGLPGVG